MNHLIKTALMGSLLASFSSFSADLVKTTNALSPHPELDIIDQFNHSTMQVTDIKRVLASNVARDLKSQNKHWLNMLNKNHTAKLSKLHLTQNNQQLMQSANARTRSLKGLEQENSNLYQLRLASEKMLEQWQDGQ